MKGVKSLNSDKHMVKNNLIVKYEKSKPELIYLSDSSQKPNRAKGINLPYQNSDTNEYSR
jgi:hypothetical protein